MTSDLQFGKKKTNASRIQLGDLVGFEESFFQDSDSLKDYTGLVVKNVMDDVEPALLEVFWSDGTFETLYEDELRLLPAVENVENEIAIQSS